MAYNDYEYSAAFAANWRLHSCFLGETSENYRADLCFSAPSNAPTLLMWGDSHSADLAKSVEDFSAPSGVHILQATMAGCRPILQLPRTANIEGACASFNAKTLSLIEKYRPMTVVLSARWEEEENYFPALRDTIVKLVGLGSHVIVVGPVMTYNERPSISFYAIGDHDFRLNLFNAIAFLKTM